MHHKMMAASMAGASDTTTTTTTVDPSMGTMGADASALTSVGFLPTLGSVGEKKPWWFPENPRGFFWD